MVIVFLFKGDDLGVERLFIGQILIGLNNKKPEVRYQGVEDEDQRSRAVRH